MRLARCVAVGEPRAALVYVTGAGEGDPLDALRGMTDIGFVFAEAEVADWDRDLSPWPAPPAFGKVPFGGQARGALAWLLSEALPRLDPALPRVIGGYSLAGLFALWAHYECDAFDAVVAASPSVWYPGWDAYADAHAPRGAAYLSLGKQEPRTRNRQMATVGDAIRRQADRFRDIPATLAWNEGNHFAEPEVRVARGFEWALRTIAGNGIKRIQSTEK